MMRKKSSAEIRMSSRICRRSPGEISRPLWSGTVVTRPSGCRNCLCEPRCRISTKPSCCNAAMTCRGLSIGSLTTLGHFNQLRTDELRLNVWFTILKQHLDNFPEIAAEFVKTLTLRVCAGHPRNESDIEAGVGVPFDNGSKCSSHSASLPWPLRQRDADGCLGRGRRRIHFLSCPSVRGE